MIIGKTFNSNSKVAMYWGSLVGSDSTSISGGAPRDSWRARAPTTLALSYFVSQLGPIFILN